MDSVGSPLQLVVPKDVQVTFTSSMKDPLQIKFDNSKAYERRANLVGNLNMNPRSGAGSLFCFDYLGDNSYKADLLSYLNNHAPDMHNSQDLIVQISSSTTSSKEKSSKVSKKNKSKHDSQPKTSSATSKSIQSKRLEEKDSSTAKKGIKHTTKKTKNVSEIIPSNRSAPSGRRAKQANSRTDSRSEREEREGSPSTNSRSARLPSQEDLPSKPSDRMKIRDVLTKNVKAYTALIDQRQRTEDLGGSSDNSEDGQQSLNRYGAKIGGDSHRKGAHIGQAHKKFINQEASGEGSLKGNNCHKLDIVDYFTGNRQTRPLESSDSVRVLQLDLKRDLEKQEGLEGSISSVTKKHNPIISDQVSQIDERIMKDLQRSLHQKYIKSQSGSKQASVYGEKSVPKIVDDNLHQPSEQQDESWSRSGVSKQNHLGQDVSFSTCNKLQSDSQRENLLNNLKLLEKEISGLQKKKDMNRQEEEYLQGMYTKLSLMSKKLSAASIEQAEREDLQGRSTKGKQRRDYGEQEAAYSPDTIDRKAGQEGMPASLMKRGDTPEFSNAYQDKLSGDHDRSYKEGGYLLGKKYSKASKASYPDSIDCKFPSNYSHKSVLTNNSALYMRQMDQKRQKEMRLEKKRQALKEQELQNCTFKPTTKRHRTVVHG